MSPNQRWFIALMGHLGCQRKFGKIFEPFRLAAKERRFIPPEIAAMIDVRTFSMM